MSRGGYFKLWDDPSSISVLTADEAYRRRRKERRARNAAGNGSSLPPIDEAFSPDDLMGTFDRLALKGGPAPGLDRLTYRAVSRREIAGLLRRPIFGTDVRQWSARIVGLDWPV
jgi:hypothetical protein